MRYRQIIAGLAGLALLSGCGPPVMAATQSATTPLTYTVSVNGSWSGSWTVTETSGSYTSKSAPSVNVPADKPYTAHGNLVVTIPALPSGYQYYGSWSLSNPGLLSNTWCGVNAPDSGQPTFSIPASGGTITEPLSAIWGTMPATSSGVAPCDIAIGPPLVASTSGSEKSQFNTLDLALPVSIVQPKPKPSPSPSKSTSPSHSVSPSKSPSPSKTKPKATPLPILTVSGLPTHTNGPKTLPFTVSLKTAGGQLIRGQSVSVALTIGTKGDTLATRHVTTNAQGQAADTLHVGATAGLVRIIAVGDKVHAFGQTTVIKPTPKPVVKKSPTPTPSQQPTHQPTPVTHHAVQHHKHPATPPFPWWILVIAVVLGGTWIWTWRRRISRQQSEE